MAYHWPGNIRELSHVIERAVLFADQGEVTANDIMIKNKAPQVSGQSLPFMTLEQADKALLLQALQKCDGQTTEAAELLGISKSAIYRRMEKYDIKN